ncbi:class I SAM-dependent methyltransferase [Orrella dioscoreae]|uniref:Methyltransferase, putative n=2 Tax=root TaxID=1 RepID=A0A1C3JZ87_9BURK|nr:class I SAM-dependent methyltransferase [Orrella dioscoreae]SBT24570.1 methyltransferase, putative [Orrella dioscoreae]SOE49490.1 methyltransferase, putative [Orrella dioscoreae]
MKCRHCGTDLHQTFVDLGTAPPSNAYLRADELSAPETYYPLKVKVCHHCWLVQTEDYAEADALFSKDYAYFSSTSSSWLAHARHYAQAMTQRLALGADDLVIELASNDGYLLRNFVEAGIPCLGIEPTDSTAQAAQALGIPVLREFFGEALGRRLAAEGRQADLIAGNNVYAHVPDINDFTRGIQAALKPGGTVTLEFPHLLQLITHAQFDTIYHEHFSYLSLYTVARIFAAAGLRVCDVEELPTHGGSLRVYGCHADDARADTAAVANVLAREAEAGLQDAQVYADFQARVEAIKDNFLDFLIAQKRAGKRVAAYGAAAKGNTLLNYAGVKPDLLPLVCDAAQAKQDKFLPGSRIPVRAPAALAEFKPDLVVIFPWNIAQEIVAHHAYIEAWGGRFVTVVPRLEIR